MIIPFGFIEAVIKRSSLERTKKGLSLELIKQYNLDSVRYDDDLIIIPIAMSEPVAKFMARKLEKDYNLVHLNSKGEAVDFVLCSKLVGNFNKCDWLVRDYLKEPVVIDKQKYKKGTTFYKLNTTTGQ